MLSDANEEYKLTFFLFFVTALLLHFDIKSSVSIAVTTLFWGFQCFGAFKIVHSVTISQDVSSH